MSLQSSSLTENKTILKTWLNSIEVTNIPGSIEVGNPLHEGLSTSVSVPNQTVGDRQQLMINNQTLNTTQANLGDNPAFDLIGSTQLRNDPQYSGIDGSGFSVAVIDTGIDTTHPLLAPNYVAGYDFVDNDSDPNDPQGHGTHVAGIVGATDETIGVAPDVGLIGLRVADSDGGALITDVEAALEWVLENREQYNITAVNLSLGLGFFTTETEVQGSILIDDIERLEAAGVTVIASTGNNYFANSELPNQENIAFPAIFSTIAVGAVWQDNVSRNIAWQSGSIDYSTGADRIVSFSQRLPVPNVVFAPGAIITSTLPGGEIGGLAGTSQAAPHVAGSVALLQEASLQFGGRLLTPDEVLEILSTTGEVIIDGDDEDDNILNTNSSYIRVNLYNAVAEVQRRSEGIVTPTDNTPSPTAEDVNGTISGTVTSLVLNGAPVDPIRESIGWDGSEVRNHDVDLFQLILPSSGTVRIEISADSSNPQDFDSYLRLFDAAGNQITANDDLSLTNAFSLIEANLPAGTFYIGVSGDDNFNYDPNIPDSGIGGDTGNYTLQLELTNQEPSSDSRVYRFFRPELGVHFYTASTAERDSVIASLPNYIYEGESYNSVTNADPLTGASPVYRFFNTTTGAHLYTISEAERDNISSNLPNYNFEGIAYYGYASDRPGTTPLYRFYNPVIDTHFYTPSAAERDEVLANLPDYQLEGQDGIAFYVEPII